MIHISRFADHNLGLVRRGLMTVEAYVELHFDQLYEHYLNNGEMPYGVAKARDGDPHEWLIEQVEKEAK